MSALIHRFTVHRAPCRGRFVPVGTKTGGIAIANYHLSIQIISRGKNRSAIAAAAYRAAERIYNERIGMAHDYTNKGGVIHTEIFLPDNAPREYANRAVLWNAVEKIEAAKNSQLAREVEFSLPRELTIEQNISLAHEYVKRTFVDKGMCADVCIHDKGDGNPHVHVMLTMRPFEVDGKWGAKSAKEYILDERGEKIRLASGEYKSRKISTTDWNNQDNAEIWRAAWSDYANAELGRQGFDTRIDHKSYARQGLDIVPSIHMGIAASQLEQKGIRTERGDKNREIAVINSELRQLKARIAKLQKWLKEEMQNTEPPTLADVISNILERRQGYYSSTNGLKAAANILNFLTSNSIKDLTDLDACFQTMISKQFDMRDNLRKVERRMDTLDKHLMYSDMYKGNRKYKIQYEKLYAEYTTLKKAKGFGAAGKAKKALDAANGYYETHRDKILGVENAERYLKDILQKHFDPAKLPSITKWTAERDKLNNEHLRINAEYKQLKTDTAAAERIRSNVHDIMRIERRREQPQRSRSYEMEL